MNVPSDESVERAAIQRGARALRGLDDPVLVENPAWSKLMLLARTVLAAAGPPPSPPMNFEAAQEVAESMDYTPIPASPSPAERELVGALEECVEAIRLTREYVGESVLPAVPGWAWFDADRRARAALAASPSPEEEAGRGEWCNMPCNTCGSHYRPCPCMSPEPESDAMAEKCACGCPRASHKGHKGTGYCCTCETCEKFEPESEEQG